MCLVPGTNKDFYLDFSPLKFLLQMGQCPKGEMIHRLQRFTHVVACCKFRSPGWELQRLCNNEKLNVFYSSNFLFTNKDGKTFIEVTSCVKLA